MYSGIATIDSDADLDALRGTERFKPARETIAGHAETRIGQFRDYAKSNAKIRVLAPPRHDPVAPAILIIALHGTGGTGDDMARLWRGVAFRRNALLVAPDALRPASPNSAGFSWTYRDEAAWYIPWVIDQVRNTHALSEVILTGYSQGANIAFMLGRTQPDAFRAVIPVSGHYERETPPPASADGPGWYLLVGERDPWATTYGAAVADLRASGVPVHGAVIPRAGHRLYPSSRVTRELDNALAWALSPAASGTTAAPAAPAQTSPAQPIKERDKAPRRIPRSIEKPPLARPTAVVD
ncbi:MAG: hypothetical protein AAF235_00755 [Planctomycetota bacterium]